MRARDEKRIEKLFSGKVNDKKRAIAACKKIGNCEIFGTGQKSPKCKNCKGILKTVCDFAVTQKPERKNKSERPWDLVVADLYNDVERKKIVAKCIKKGMTESAARDFVSSAGCVVNTVKGKNRKNGLVSAYIDYLRKGSKGPEPEGSKNLIYYCKQVFNHCMQNPAISAQIVK